ncbi:MAG: hypothetical protein ACPGVU_24765, partial [Limisphaerales bacterium]
MKIENSGVQLREAKANELVPTRIVDGDVSEIFNPTVENLIFKIAILGDEVQRGSQKISIAHKPWLPSGSRLRVT